MKMDKEQVLLKEYKSKKIKSFLEYMFPALITMAIFLFAMLIKGVYPFGKESFGYVDFNDGLVPAYTALWDVLHGRQNIFVNWDLGAGGSFVSSAVLNSFLSPICWIIAIFARENVIYSISLVVIILLALMATTAYICFKKFYPNVNNYILLLFSLIWTFSGWTLVHFTNVGWLNLMVLLPLLLLAAKKLVEDGKILWFVIVLSYMLMLSYYITYMVLVGVVIVSTIYIILLANNKKKIASNLFFAIMISILISFVAFIPSCLTSLQGHRFSGTATGNPKMELFNNFFSKCLVLLMYALPFVFFVKLLMKYKEDKKPVLFFLLSFLICSVGILIEPINQMWHTGSYFSFPFRYSFLIILILIMGSLYYINKYITLITSDKDNVAQEYKQKTKTLFKNIIFIVCLIFAVLSSIIIFIFGSAYLPFQETEFNVFIIYSIMFGCTFVVFWIALKSNNKKYVLGKIAGGLIIFIICLFQILGLTTGYVGYIIGTKTEDVFNALEVDCSDLLEGYKIKDKENLYNLNFPYLMEYTSMHTWIHISSEEQFVGYNKLGYNTVSTCLSSAGGTIISDVLLGNRYVLSRLVLD